MKKFDIYLFDFDGTLVDTFRSLTFVFTSAFRDFGIKVNEQDCLEFSREPLPISFKRKGGNDIDYPAFIKRINEYLNNDETTKMSELFIDTIPLIHYLIDNHVVCGIVTNNNIPHVKEVLSFLKIPLSTFSIYTGNHEVKQAKPDPSSLLYSIKQYGYKGCKNRVAYIGDGLNDVLAAKRAGMTPILIDRENSFPIDSSYIKITNLMDLFKND